MEIVLNEKFYLIKYDSVAGMTPEMEKALNKRTPITCIGGNIDYLHGRIDNEYPQTLSFSGNCIEWVNKRIESKIKKEKEKREKLFENYKENQTPLSLYRRNVLKERYIISNRDISYRIAFDDKPSQLYTCCSCTKTTANIRAYISLNRISHYRHTKNFIKNYLDFLVDCNIGFNYNIPTEPDIHKFNEQDDLLKNYTEKTFSITTSQENCFRVDIINSFKNDANQLKATYANYMYFILIRYMTSPYYMQIPIVAMQIKNVLGDLVTNWQAMLMAHYCNNIDGYYALFGTVDYINVNPFTSPEYTLNLLDKVNMNHSFKRVEQSEFNNFETIKEIQNMFLNKEYLNIYNKLKQIFDESK